MGFLLAALTATPDLWVQKGYLCRVVSVSEGGFVDEGTEPLAHFLDFDGPDAVAATVEVDRDGSIVPTVYLRRDGEITEHGLPPHPMHANEDEPYRRELAALFTLIG